MDNLQRKRLRTPTPGSIIRSWKVYRPKALGGAWGSLGAIAAVICVMLVAVKVAIACTNAGSVTVTASMGQFSPNPVEVNKPATSILSAGYTPPSGVSEVDLSATYAWSVASVQYKSQWLNAQGKAAQYGPPPSGQYTDPIDPSTPSTSSSATLAFTSPVAGYWQVSVSCSVTVTDTKTNQCWSGSAVAGPQPLTVYVLHIQYGGNVVDSQTQDVCVGEYIGLTAEYGPSDMTLQWTVAGSTIYAYEADNQQGVIIPLTPADFTYADLYYYWMDTDSGSTENENVKLTGTLPAGGSPPPVNTTFNVYRPVPTFSTQYLGAISLDTSYGPSVGTLCLHDGDEQSGGYDPGIEFTYSIPPSQFGDTSNLTTVQISDRGTITTQQYNSANKNTTTFEYTLPDSALAGPLLDTSFPYPQEAYGQTSDSPGNTVSPPPAGSGFGAGSWETVSVTVSETFTHNLLFLPDLPNGGVATYAPLSEVSWGWNAEADNPGQSGFYLANSAKLPPSPPTGADLSTLPQWNNNVQPSWSDPQWFVAN